MKRRFERRAASLLDREARCSIEIDRGQPDAGDAAPVHELLERVEAGDDRAAGALIRRPEARASVPAFFARNVPANYATLQLATSGGGPGAREWLGAQLTSYVARAQSLPYLEVLLATRCAGGLLALDPDAEDAAAALIGWFNHPVDVVRIRAVGEAARAVASVDLRTRAHVVLREALGPLVRTDDPQVFAAALPALARLDGDVFVRAKEWLASAPNPWARSAVAWALLASHNVCLALPILLDWIRREPSLRLRVEHAWPIGRVLPTRWIITQFARGLADDSPSLREAVLSLEQFIPPKRAHALLELALLDEPDPYIRKSIRAASRSARRRSSSR